MDADYCDEERTTRKRKILCKRLQTGNTQSGTHYGVLTIYIRYINHNACITEETFVSIFSRNSERSLQNFLKILKQNVLSWVDHEHLDV